MISTNIILPCSFYLYSSPEVQTLIGQEVTVGYFIWVQMRGFKHGQLWSCPPVKNSHFIFSRENKRKPNAVYLRKWYGIIFERLLSLGVLEVEIASMWSKVYQMNEKTELSSSSGRRCKSGGTTAAMDGPENAPVCPPVFEGDEWYGDPGTPLPLDGELTTPMPQFQSPALGFQGAMGEMKNIAHKISLVADDLFSLQFSSTLTKMGENYLSKIASKILNNLVHDTSDPDGLVESPIMDSRYNFLKISKEREYDFSSMEMIKKSSMELIKLLHFPNSLNCVPPSKPGYFEGMSCVLCSIKYHLFSTIICLT